MENYLFNNLMFGYKILFLILIGQAGLMIFFNWTKKTIYLIRKDFIKFICLFVAVSSHFFMYHYLFTENKIYEVLELSLFIIPLSVFIVIDFCVQI